MPIRKKGEKVKGTTRVSYGDRKLMTRLWIADKTSRYEKRRATRAMTLKEKEFFAQCPSVRAETAYKDFKKDMKVQPKRFALPEDEEDEDIVAIDCASRFAWYRLVRRHNGLLDDNKVFDTFLRDNIRGNPGKAKLAELDDFTADLYKSMCLEEDDAALPKSITVAQKIAESCLQKQRCDGELLPLMFARKNMRLVYQYQRLAKRQEQFSETVTSSSSHSLLQHMFHGAFAAEEEEKGEKKSVMEHLYSFETGGIHASDGSWSLIDGNAAPSRPMIQPSQWHVQGDSIVGSIAKNASNSSSSSSCALPSPLSLPSPLFNGLESGLEVGKGREGRGSGDVGGYGFANEEKQRQHLKTEQRVNNIVFRHAYEVERQASMWTTCQRCRTPVHTCDMVVRESLGVEDISCFHPQCLQDVNDARHEQMDAAEKREQMVASFTPLPVENKKQVRDSVYEEIYTPIVAAQEKRREWKAKRAKEEEEGDGELVEKEDRGVGKRVEGGRGGKKSAKKRKRPSIDDILQDMLQKRG